MPRTPIFTNASSQISNPSTTHLAQSSTNLLYPSPRATFHRAHSTCAQTANHFYPPLEAQTQLPHALNSPKDSITRVLHSQTRHGHAFDLQKAPHSRAPAAAASARPARTHIDNPIDRNEIIISAQPNSPRGRPAGPDRLA